MYSNSTVYLVWGSVHALDGDGRRFTAADAERRHAAGPALPLQGVQQRHDETGAGGADRVAERAGPTVDVEPVARNAEVAGRRHRDDRKGLVDLEEVDIAD